MFPAISEKRASDGVWRHEAGVPRNGKINGEWYRSVGLVSSAGGKHALMVRRPERRPCHRTTYEHGNPSHGPRAFAVAVPFKIALGWVESPIRRLSVAWGIHPKRAHLLLR
jgi:hypothetical protein